MSDEFTDIMVDIETVGTSPDRTGIIQIAAVKFNLEKRTVCPTFFNNSLTIPAHRSWDEDTRLWWTRQKPGQLQEIMARQRPWRDVMEEFLVFARQRNSLTFWSKPTTFDYMFIQSYFKDADLPNPFHYNNVTDLKSYLKGLHHPFPVPELNVPNVGDAHNALNDTLWQLKHLFAHADYQDDLNKKHGIEVVDA